MSSNPSSKEPIDLILQEDEKSDIVHDPYLCRFCNGDVRECYCCQECGKFIVEHAPNCPADPQNRED